MSIYFDRLFNDATTFFKESILTPLATQHKKIAFIASMAFSCLAICYLIKHYFFTAKIFHNDEYCRTTNHSHFDEILEKKASINTVPNEILAYIFSFLEFESLSTVAKVSRKWNEVQKKDELWKNYCLTYLDRATPYQNSWLERFKIINNWKKGLAEVNSYPLSYKALHHNHDFTILEDGTFFEIYPNHQNPFIYTIHNWSKNKNKQIDLKAFESSEVICTDLDDKTWIVLNSRCEILCFDIQKGECVKKIIPKHIKRNLNKAEGKIKAAADEIVTVYDKMIKIWNPKTALLEQSIDISNFCEVSNLNFTPNFIICSPFIPFAIQKSNRTIKRLSDLSFRVGFNCVATSGIYVAMLGISGEVRIFKDSPNDLNLIHCLHTLSPPSNLIGTIHTYKNWLLTSKNGVLNIWNIKTGKMISAFEIDKKRIELRTNAIKLIFREILGDNPLFEQNYSYTVVDFSQTL